MLDPRTVQTSNAYLLTFPEGLDASPRTWFAWAMMATHSTLGGRKCEEVSICGRAVVNRLARHKKRALTGETAPALAAKHRCARNYAVDNRRLSYASQPNRQWRVCVRPGS